jgi:hypothetical protein
MVNGAELSLYLQSFAPLLFSGFLMIRKKMEEERFGYALLGYSQESFHSASQQAIAGNPISKGKRGDFSRNEPPESSC